MKKVFTILSLMILSISCSKVILPTANFSAGEQRVSNEENSAASIISNSAPKPTLQNSKQTLPAVKDFGIHSFLRISKNMDSAGFRLPPYENAEVSSLVSKNKIQAGEKATVIPLQIDREPFDLKIASVGKTRMLDCDVERDALEGEFETVNDKELLEIKPTAGRSEESPFDVLVIYPAAASAKKLNPNELTKKMLPKNVAAKEVFAAIDLNGDAQPDLLITKYCCDSSAELGDENCGNDCGAAYKKVNSVWKFMYSLEGC